MFLKLINKKKYIIPSQINNFFFDFDGVILESLEVKSNAFRQLYNNLSDEEIQNLISHHEQNHGLSRYEKIKLYHKKYYNINLSNIDLDKLSNKLSNIILEKIFDTDYVPGILSFLKKLQNKKRKIFIITGTPEFEINYILKKKKIHEIFTGIYGSPAKKTDHLENLIKQYNVDTDKSIFFGDAYADYSAAKEFNIEFILRQHSDNINIFKNISCLKICDFVINEDN
tara:strand:+ start:13115 stop:13795 length:681 start_codon:yes stop_codon:yes gene_type:complete